MPSFKSMLILLVTVMPVLAPGTDAQAQSAADTTITPFEIAIPEQAITDLHRRLEMARLPAQIPDTGWEYGTNSQYLKELVEYWRNEFDWRQQEEELNAFDQYMTTIDGVPIHFIHQRSSNPDATPLMVTHGWPGSIAEFRHIIGPLTEPQNYGGNAEDAFHVIAPSLLINQVAELKFLITVGNT